jgi:hypothetical protein
MLRVGTRRTYVSVTDGIFGTEPWTGIGTPPDWVQQFEIGRLEGWLTTLSLHGRFRAAENRQARALHYRIRKYPYVPLMGLIVRAEPRKVLEVYEDVQVFKSARGAEDWLVNRFGRHLDRPPVAPEEGPVRMLSALPRLGDQTLGYEQSPANPSWEDVIGVYVRTRGLIVSLLTQGGHEMSVRTGVDLARDAVKRVIDHCPVFNDRRPA